MRIFYIQMKDRQVEITAKNRDYAFAKLFKDVADDKIHLSELGNIVMLKQKNARPDQEYPFRTVPLLWQMKLITAEIAVSNIMAVTGVEQKEAEKMLTQMSFVDSKLLPLIEELRRKENC